MADRQCHPCTACCEGWLTADINGERMKPGKPCVHQFSEGCRIYPERPETPCVKFKCGWLLEHGELPEFMKPSECGVIVQFLKMYGRQVISAVPVGQEIRKDTLDWLTAFAREKSLPLVFSKRIVRDGRFIGIQRIGYGPPSFIEMVKLRLGSEDVIRF